MSLALGVDIAGGAGTTRITAAAGLSMSSALALAALEQFRFEASGGRGWLCVAGAAVCAAWCAFACRRSAARRQVRLQIEADGTLRLATCEGAEKTVVAAVTAWHVGGVICLRLRPGLGSGDCLFLLTRGAFDEASWHGLRRWLVWYRRSRRREPVAA